MTIKQNLKRLFQNSEEVDVELKLQELEEARLTALFKASCGRTQCAWMGGEFIDEWKTETTPRVLQAR